jgi:GAF domain-containing protein
VRREYERIWSLLGSRTIEELIDLPLMDDPATLATVEVLSRASSPTAYTDANLTALTICKAISLSLEYGNCDASCFAYVMLAMVAGPRFGEYQAGFRFGQLGYELVERRGLRRFEASTYHLFVVFVVRWMKHVRARGDLLGHAFEAANRIGDLTRAAYTRNTLNSDLLFAGEPLPVVQGEAERGLAFVEKARFGLVIDIITTQLALIRMLRGFTLKCGCFDDGQFHELHMESRLSGNPALAIATCWYWIRKLQARYLAGDYAAAMDAASKAQGLLWTSSSLLEEAEHHFYAALARAAYCDFAPAGERQQRIDAIAAHYRRLQVWAANCPENFENRAALVGAEIARIEGRDVDAMRLFEQAIHSARANGFVHNEALAYERASAFYRARGFDQFAELYLRNARYGYLRWGAEGKVRQLEEMHPQLTTEEPAPGPTNTIATPVEHLDLATVIKVSQTVSSEMVLDKLTDTLMRTAIEQAGAERGLLIVEQRIAAEAVTSGDSVLVQLCDEPVTTVVLPESVLHYVVRTNESVILDDAAAQSAFVADPYIRQRQARSILCLPLINQGRLNGVLYLENNLTPRVFLPARITVLKLLASQAAIAVENSRLYRDLAEREAKIRRLVDANIIGSSSGRSQGKWQGRSSRLMTRFCAWWDTTAKISFPAAYIGQCAGCSGNEDDWNRPSVRKGVFPEGRQPCARTGRGGEPRKRVLRRGLRARCDRAEGGGRGAPRERGTLSHAHAIPSRSTGRPMRSIASSGSTPNVSTTRRRQTQRSARPAGNCPTWSLTKKAGASTVRRSTRICRSAISNSRGPPPTVVSATCPSRGSRYSIRRGASTDTAALRGISPNVSAPRRLCARRRCSWRTRTASRRWGSLRPRSPMR